jgi:hypothetical protein
MKLLYGTTTEVHVTITNRFYGSLFHLYMAEDFNAWPHIPPSSSPFQFFLDYREMVRTNDLNNPKFTTHISGIKFHIRRRLSNPDRQTALRTVQRMGIQAMQPFLAILEVETYLQHHYPAGGRGLASFQVPSSKAGSPSSIEYFFPDIRGPTLPNAELHIQKLYI